MKRVIVDYKKLTPKFFRCLLKYPDGYDDDHIITFKNSKNETIEAVEVRTANTIYLVKVSSRLEISMANFDEEDYDETEFSEPIAEILEDKKLEDVEDIDLDDEEE